MSLSLLEDKLQALMSLLAWWATCKSATKHQLQEFLGHLNHAASVIRPDLRSLIEVMKRLHLPGQSTRLDPQVWADIASFAPQRPHVLVTLDALGGWGCDAFVSPSLRLF